MGALWSRRPAVDEMALTPILVAMTVDHPAPQRSLDILVPTCDRPTRLAAMMGSLAAQDLPPGAVPIRVYVLDNGNTSAFADFDVARQLDVLQLRGFRTFYLRRPHLVGVCAVRRHLYEAGNGQLVCYLDDDVVLAPATLSTLWHGVADLGFTLAASLVLDIDGVHGEEIGLGHRVRDTLCRLADDIETEPLATFGDTWIELVTPFGTNLMFMRSVFDSLGSWSWMEPFFSAQPDAWGEDVGLCVALKSVGEACIDVGRIVSHLSPRRRLFAGWQTPEAFAKILIERFGADHPAGIVSSRRDPRDALRVASQLRARVAEL